MNRKFILIAKCYESSLSGPANIVRGLVTGFHNKNIMITPILLKENTSRIVFLKTIVKEVLKSRDAIVNVHSDGFLIPLLVYFLSILNRKNSYYLTAHGIYQVEARMENKEKLRYVLLERFLYKYFPNMICVSEMLENDIKEQVGRKKRIYVIANATDAKSDKMLVCDRKHIEIIALGGLRKRKGFDEMLGLCDVLRAKEIPFVLNIYGSGEENREEFQQRVKQMGLQSCVRYLGNLRNRQDVYDVVQTADIQMCLSKYDTFNVAIAESLVLGCPCIATDRCGASYLIDNGYNGLIINLSEETQNRYTKCIKYIELMINHPEIRKQIYEQKEEYANVLSWSTIVDKYASLE